ncbi:uncharacterized protein LOC106874177 [Octopus bimaculoides]|uniref:AKNA domain-containing protein n=1 Tax=Octopus bimaculoides TaxID=37653 RepID=A0A0L8GX97_OCTBM|nr:uncharacterized protein LOC106874177 [Octopus bimaculoides]
MYENDCDFLIDDYGILLDRSPGSLLLDENGIVQDGRNDGPEHSSIFWQSDGGFGDHPEISDFKTEMHQNLLEECGLPETRYCISDLELSDEEKSFPDKLENISPDILFDDRNGFCLQLNCQSVELKPRDSESCQKYSLQHFKESLDVSKDKSNNSFDEDPLAALLVKHEEPFDIHENSDEVCEDGEFLGNKEFFVKNYYTCYQNPSEMVRIPSLGGKLSSSAVKGLSPSETGMEKENYPNKEFCRESDEDELFLITGHIDFSEEKPFQQESEDLALRSLKVSESGQRSDKTISSKHSTEIFPEIFNVSNSGNENNFNHCRSSVNPVEDLQIPSPYDKEQIKETGESNPDFTFWNYSSTINSSVSENRFNELKDQSQKYFDDCTPNLHDVHCINTTDGQFDIERKNMFALSAVPQDKNEINSTGRLHANTFLIKDFTNLKTMQNDYMDQELSNSKSGMTADEICQELPDKTTTSLIQHESAVDVSNNCCKRKNSCGKMDKVENKIKFPESKEVTLEEREKGKDGEVKKEEEVDSRTWPTSGEILKSSRIKSKSVTDVSCHLTPVKSKHKSLIELNKLQTDQGSSENLSTFSSVMELNDKLVQESEKRRKATELVEELQNQYSDLLTRYADAANTIDEMRLGASSAPLLSSRNGSQTFMNNINFCRPLVTSTPLHSAFLANQDSRNEGCMKSGFHGNSESKKFQQEGNHDLESQKYVSKAESIKITLLKEARNLEKMMNSLETLLEQNQLTRKEQKKFIEKVCTEQNKQRRQYLRIKEEFVIGSAANGNIFDEDKELEGYLFDLQMRFDELEDKYQTLQDNLKEPFQSGDSCSPVDSLDGTKESENVPEDGMINDSYEARKGKFLVQYNVLMDKYWQLKLSGSLDDGDQEMKEITEKLRQIKKELCQNEQHQQQQQQREHNM